MDQKEIASLMQTLTTGIYGIGAHANDQSRIFTASWVMPVSFDPVLLAVSINPQNRSYGLIKESQRFSINVIKGEDLYLAEQMAAPGDRLSMIAWQPGLNGCPLIDEALAHLECEVIHEVTAGDHQLVVARLCTGKLLKPKATPLLYADTGSLDGAAALFPERI